MTLFEGGHNLTGQFIGSGLVLETPEEDSELIMLLLTALSRNAETGSFCYPYH